ncbi:MAG: lactonase family protein [Propionibacteriales bacterium]|nr:lactonase family protein [Propionibacteriales bacterium]
MPDDVTPDEANTRETSLDEGSSNTPPVDKPATKESSADDSPATKSPADQVEAIERRSRGTAAAPATEPTAELGAPAGEPAGLADQQVTDTGVDAESGIRIVIGGYTGELDGHAAGLSGYRWNASNAEEVEVVAFDPITLPSPTWIAAHPNGSQVYTVSETTPGQVHAVQVTDSGDLVLINSVASGGDGGCHTAVSPDGRHLVVAHYGSGSVATFGIGEHGALSEVLDRAELAGTGPDPVRQEAGHAHQAVFDGDVLLITNLGNDRIHRFTLGDDGALTELDSPIVLPDGSGPRHLVITGEHMAVACELSAQVWLGRRGTSGWGEVAVVASSGQDHLPADIRVHPSGIAVVGDEVLVANRGNDTVAVLALDRATDALELTSEFDSVGAWPRDLMATDGRIWVANQVDDLVSVFVRRPDNDGGRGRWELDFQIPSPSPACVAIIPPTTNPSAALTTKEIDR